jgi:hypothetical protein
LTTLKGRNGPETGCLSEGQRFGQTGTQAVEVVGIGTEGQDLAPQLAIPL